MKNYTEIERLDAQRIKAIRHRIFEDKDKWDEIYQELKEIYDNIPSDGYVNSFEEDGKFYYKFWDEEEFVSYCNYLEQTDSNIDVVWIENAYPICCYYLAIISYDRRDFDLTRTFLEKGIELEPDNPLLLIDLGFLYCQFGMNSDNDDFYDKGFDCYDKAFDSRPFNTGSQKASALSGMGFWFLKFEDYDTAKKFYNLSLTWEESEYTRSRLQKISDIEIEKEFHDSRACSILRDKKSVIYFQYVEELRKKLPEILQDKIPSKYVYIWSEASKLLNKGFSEYLEDKLFTENDEAGLVWCVSQIVHYLRGIDPSHCIEVNCLEKAMKLLSIFQFEVISYDQIFNENQEEVQSVSLKHTVDNDEIDLFFKINQLEK